MLTRLKKLLGKIESAVTDNQGLVNYKDAHNNENWKIFEEAVCELQGVDMGLMDESTKLAFGINVYNLMIKYAFMKVGIGTTSVSRNGFFGGVKMNIGGDIMSFNELENIENNVEVHYDDNFNPTSGLNSSVHSQGENFYGSGVYGVP